MRRLFLCFLVLAMAFGVLAMAFGSVGLVDAVIITPSVRASIHDEPRDGIGDSFNLSPFEGLLRQQISREDRAIIELDLSSFSGTTLTQAKLDFTISVNNSGGSQFREFDVLLYFGNGLADLSDFSDPATFVTTIGYSVPDGSKDFSLDVLDTTQAILADGALFIGMRLDPIGNDNFPSILVADSSITIEAIPETTIDITVNPNPAVVGGPLEILLDLDNPGDGFNANFGLYVLVVGNVTTLLDISPFVSSGSMTGVSIFSTASVPAGLPNVVGFVAAIFNADSGDLLDWDFEEVVIGVAAPSADDITALRQTATEYLQ